jgi:hypothetical protein
MRQCHFCERWFRNKQSVRAHLKACSNYKHQLHAGLVVGTQTRFVGYYQCPACYLPGEEGICRADMLASQFPRADFGEGRLCCPLCFTERNVLVPMKLVERRKEPVPRRAPPPAA